MEERTGIEKIINFDDVKNEMMANFIAKYGEFDVDSLIEMAIADILEDPDLNIDDLLIMLIIMESPKLTEVIKRIPARLKEHMAAIVYNKKES